MPEWGQWPRKMMKRERGFSLLEVLVAVALIGIVAVAIYGGLATASKSMLTADERATAESLARTEMEYIKEFQYTKLPSVPPSWSYELVNPTDTPPWDSSHTLPAGYDGYSVTVNGTTFDGNGTPNSNIQKITITIKHHDKAIITSGNCTLEDYKVYR